MDERTSTRHKLDELLHIFADGLSRNGVTTESTVDYLDGDSFARTRGL